MKVRELVGYMKMLNHIKIRSSYKRCTDVDDRWNVLYLESKEQLEYFEQQDIKNLDIDKFKNTCDELNVKLHILNNKYRSDI